MESLDVRVGTRMARKNNFCHFAWNHGPVEVKHDDISSKIFGWVDFFVFVLLMFALGFATNAKMYALLLGKHDHSVSISYAGPFHLHLASWPTQTQQLQVLAGLLLDV